MKNVYSILLLFAILFMGACKKYIDKEFNSKCIILKVISDPGTIYEGEGVFSYTSWGAPKSIIVSNEGTGSPSYFFYYDNKRRLVGFIEGFAREDDTLYHSYHRYVYENDVVVRDTTFGTGHTADRYESDVPYWLGTYTYDKWGRIIHYFRIVHYEDESFTQEFDYNYENENPYVKNRSIMGTHPVLMFVNQDYHKTNEAVFYNEFGYPTDFGSKAYWFKLTPVHQVVYECNVPGHGH
jgi:hypothetical protein